MAQTHLLAVPNRDLLSSFTFNFYGTRLAASSLDHHVYVLTSDPSTGAWPEDDDDEDEDEDGDGEADRRTVQVDGGKGGIGRGREKGKGTGKGTVQGWSAHSGPVVKVVWADPMHGEFLASAGTDGTVRIWEEVPTSSLQHGPSTSAGTTWTLRSRLLVSRNSVRDLAFAPSEHGLKLACISADSHLRLYECLDVGTLASWNLVVDIDVLALPSGPCARREQVADGGKGNAFAHGPPPASTGASQPLTSIKGFEIGSSTRQSSASNANPFSSAAAPASTTGSSGVGGAIESDGGWAISWCPEHWWGPLLVVSSGPSSAIRLVRLGDSPSSDKGGGGGPGDWEVLEVLTPTEGSEAPVASLAWGPACGRDFQLVAAGYRDGKSRIWRLEPPSLSPTRSPSSDAWVCSMDAELTSHVVRGKEGKQMQTGGVGGGMGKVEWNVTGTVLSTSGGDGRVRIWKRNFSGYWVEVAVVSCEEGREEDVDEEGMDLK